LYFFSFLQHLIIPNVFTPNGDGNNDFFTIPKIDLTDFSLVILDEKGKTIFTSTDLDFNWDGTYAEIENNLNGQLVTTSLGLTYSLGRNKLHGDYTILKDKNIEEIDALNKRVGDVETLMNDTDKDGVADYLDQENNSVAGVAVDTRGKMVDVNRNGVPDELERYIDKSSKETSEKSNSDMIKSLVNDGYVTTYFDTAKVKPTNVSTFSKRKKMSNGGLV
jgi:OOP family OmpA-OmpF porin